jgi:hypothetical protein
MSKFTVPIFTMYLKGDCSMARQDYMTIGVPKSTQDVFREFIDVKGVTVKDALSDMMDIYMMATDIDLYTELKSKKINVEEAKNMILDRNDTVSKNVSLFMKLGVSTTASGVKIDGMKTIELYKQHCDSNRYTWYSTNSLKTGMNEKKATLYNRMAESGHLKIYFAINSKKAGINNNIAYEADVKKIVSYSTPTKAPCRDDEYPEKWKGIKNNIWIKIANLKKSNESADDFVVVSTGNNLRDVIRKGQYIFGYIKKVQK